MKLVTFVSAAVCALSYMPVLAAPGDLDPTFGTDGIVKTVIGTKKDAAAQVLLQQPDGKLVAGGWISTKGPSGFTLARYNLDGSLDTSFAVGGTVITVFRGFGDFLSALALQSDGKLVAAGEVSGKVSNGFKFNFGLARYNSDGSLDLSFDKTGKVVSSIDSADDIISSDALVVQPDGKVVAAGGAGLQLALVRYNPDGTLDTTFGKRGTVVTSIGSVAFATGLVLLPSGELVVGGYAKVESHFQFALARYDADGNLDTTFGDNGIVVTPIGGGGTEDAAFALLVQSDGRLVAAGYSKESTTGSNDYALARFDSEGNLDSTFGTGGTVITPVGPHADYIESLVQQSDGELIAAGRSNTGSLHPDSPVWDFSLAAYNLDGELDTTFGNGGTVITPVGNTKDVFSVGLVQQLDSKLVVAGQSNDGRFELVRYFPPVAPSIPTPTGPPVPLPTPTLGPCVGDCHQEGRVTVGDLVLGVNIALGSATLDECPAFDTNGDHLVGVSELIAAVALALQGCLPVAP